MSEIKQKIRQARPRLRDVAPLTASIVLGFGIMNIVFGAGLYTTTARAVNFFVINEVFTYQFWGVCFALLGVAMLVAYKINSWSYLRTTLAIGIFLKSWWLIALLVRLVAGDFNNIILLCIWGLLTYIQIVTYVHFIPTNKRILSND